MSTTAVPFCSRCNSIPCCCAPLPHTVVVASSDVDFVWRSNVTGMLVDITKHLADLAEVVHQLAERLDEEHNTGTRSDEA